MSFLLCTISLEVILYDFELKKIAKVVVCCGIEIVRQKFECVKRKQNGRIARMIGAIY